MTWIETLKWRSAPFSAFASTSSRTCASSATRSGVQPDPRVHDRVDQVDHEVDEHEGDDGEDMYIVQSGKVAISKRVRDVEKILAPNEPLPDDWACHGTSGYDFLNVVNGLFVDGRNEAAEKVQIDDLLTVVPGHFHLPCSGAHV